MIEVLQCAGIGLLVCLTLGVGFGLAIRVALWIAK